MEGNTTDPEAANATNAKRVLITDALEPSGLDILREATDVELDVRPDITADELLDCVGGYDALLIRSRTRVTAAVIENADRLKVIGRAGAGTDNIALDVATRRGVIVVNSPTGLSNYRFELYFVVRIELWLISWMILLASSSCPSSLLSAVRFFS